MFNHVPADNNWEWQMKTQSEPCPSCDEAILRMRRDEQIIDALQMARYILGGPDVIVDPALRLARAKAAIDEAFAAVETAMKLMQPRRS